MGIPKQPFKGTGVGKRLAPRQEAPHRRVVQRHHPQCTRRRPGQKPRQTAALAAAETARSGAHRRRAAAVQAVQFNALKADAGWEAASQRRLPGLARGRTEVQVLPPVRFAGRPGVLGVEVVVAGGDQHLGGRPQRPKPARRRRQFLRQPDVDQIAGDDDEVRLRLQHGAAQCLQVGGPVQLSPPPQPGPVAEAPLAANPLRREARQVG